MIFEELSLKEIKNIIFEGESPTLTYIFGNSYRPTIGKRASEY